MIDSVVSPEQLIHDPSLRLHAVYYITKQIIPALSRIFNLAGANLQTWFDKMPKVYKTIRFSSQDMVVDKQQGRTLDQYYKAHYCLVCEGNSIKGK